MKNKERKQQMLNEHHGVVKEYGHQRYELLKNGVIMDTLTADDFGINDLDYECLEQMRKAKNIQRKRINKHMQYWVDKGYEIAFITYTFNKDAMELTPNYRRQLVHRTMQKVVDEIPDYIANVDYGENELEHYHGALCCNKGTLKKLKDHNTQVDIPKLRELWKPYGFVYIQRVKIIDGIPGYIAKLVSHSLKVHQAQLIVPRLSEYHEHCKYEECYKKAVKQTQKWTRNISTAVVNDTRKRASKEYQKDLPF